MKNDIKQRAVDLQSFITVVDETQLSEPVHEKTDAGARGADHGGERLLADFGDYHLRDAVLAEMCQQKQNPRESFFAGIEELVN